MRIIAAAFLFTLGLVDCCLAQMPATNLVAGRRGEWIQRQIQNSPPVWAASGAMAYDHVRHRSVLISEGGSVWEYDGISWSHKWDGSINDGTNGPINGRDISATFKPTTEECLVLIGNTTPSDTAYDQVNNSEIWGWNGTSWHKRSSLSELSPQRRHRSALVYGPLGGTVLTGGRAETPPSGGGLDPFLEDTWLLFSSSWTLMAGNFPTHRNVCLSIPGFETRSGTVVVFETNRNCLTMVAGNSNFHWSGNRQTLEMNAPFTQWVDQGIEVSQSGPDSAFACGAYSTHRGLVVLFDSVRPCNSDLPAPSPEGWTWEREGGVWRVASTTGPRTPFAGAMCYDRDRRTMVMFGASGEPTPTAETWELPDDIDGDGLWNNWERHGFGIDDNKDGQIDLELSQYGVSVFHKDLLLEIDHMDGCAPLAGSVESVVISFADVPNESLAQENGANGNPDGAPGVRLYVEPSYETVPVMDWEDGGEVWTAQINSIFDQYFGTSTDRAETLRLASKKRAFRYGLFGRKIGGPMGRSHMPGQVFSVNVRGGSSRFQIPQYESSVLMHELGHSMGLHHGGDDEIENKPNYSSVMNSSNAGHRLVSGRPELISSFVLDYSREIRLPLNEIAIDEAAGFGGDSQAFVSVGYNVCAQAEAGTARVVSEGGPVDLNNDGDTTDVLSINLTNFRPTRTPDPCESLHGFVDWRSLHMTVRGQGLPAPFYAPIINHPEEIPIEPTELEILQYVRDHASCAVDINSDGIVNPDDLADFLAMYFALPPDAYSDFDLNGVVDPDDLSDYIVAYFAGC